jgi:ribosomal protein S18 acetylase RimI-like enzyme
MPADIKVLAPGDEYVLMNVAADVFDFAVDPRWAKEFLDDPRHHIAVAIDRGQVVGFATGVHYIHPDKPPELWVNEVGVAPTHQGQGLGKAVLNALFAEGRARNCKIAWVLTDRDNAAANKLYAATGGIEGADGLGRGLVGYSFDLDGDT